MAMYCKHVARIRDVVLSALGCEECLKMGEPWLHPRVCRTCGHVGCCDQSPNRHATKHFRATKHPIIAARQLCRNRNTTPTTRRIATKMVLITSSTDLPTKMV